LLIMTSSLRHWQAISCQAEAEAQNGLAALAGCVLARDAPTTGRALQQLGDAPVADMPDQHEG
jgi:hypothetical protein